MTNFEKIIIAAVCFSVVGVIILGVVVFRQQKTINTLTGSAVGTSKQAATQNIAKKNNAPSLTEVVKQFSGPIESISGNQLVLNVKLTDFSKPKDPEKLKNAANGPVNLSSSDFETLDKKITVNTSIKTVFDKKPLAELKAGDAISVISDKSPYIVDTVTAEKVTSESPK